MTNLKNKNDCQLQNWLISTVEKRRRQLKRFKSEKVSWTKLLGYKQTWAFAFGKFMTDGVWWFFLFWLPAYLKAQYGIVDRAVMLPLALLYTLAMVGSIGGGWFPMYFIRKGYKAI